jgi:hypothetical protein
MLTGFGNDHLTFAGLIHVADDMEVLVEFDGFAQAAATRSCGKGARGPGIAQVLK